jgi:uncharacterized membrane protein
MLSRNKVSMNRKLSPALIALTSLLISLTTVFTLLIRVPTPARGYVNLSDVAITFASLAFGPWVGMVVGGVGTALADLLGGFAPFAPLSLIAHGLEGLLMGLLAWRRRSVPMLILAWFVGSAAMICCYLVGEALFYTGWQLALLEVPLNAFQAVIGGLVGIPLLVAVRAAYPAIDELGRRKTWTDDTPPSDQG